MLYFYVICRILQYFYYFTNFTLFLCYFFSCSRNLGIVIQFHMILRIFFQFSPFFADFTLFLCSFLGFTTFLRNFSPSAEFLHNFANSIIIMLYADIFLVLNKKYEVVKTNAREIKTIFVVITCLRIRDLLIFLLIKRSGIFFHWPYILSNHNWYNAFRKVNLLSVYIKIFLFRLSKLAHKEVVFVSSWFHMVIQRMFIFKENYISTLPNG